MCDLIKIWLGSTKNNVDLITLLLILNPSWHTFTFYISIFTKNSTHLDCTFLAIVFCFEFWFYILNVVFSHQHDDSTVSLHNVLIVWSTDETSGIVSLSDVNFLIHI